MLVFIWKLLSKCDLTLFHSKALSFFSGNSGHPDGMMLLEGTVISGVPCSVPAEALVTEG